MQEFVDRMKALSDANRLRALCALRDRELCVCEIIELLGLAPSTVSKHMTVLRQAGLVKGTKRGRWMHYRLVEDKESSEVREWIDFVLRSLTSDPVAAQDRKSLKSIHRKEAAAHCSRPRQK